MRKATSTTLVTATALAALLVLAGCTTEAAPAPTRTPSMDTTGTTPTPTSTETGGALPPQDPPTTADDTLAKATKAIEDFEAVNLKLSTEAAPAESVSQYVIADSPAATVVADTVRLNAEFKAAIEGDGQFRWMTYYQTSYAAPLEDYQTGEVIEYGSAFVQGCLYNEGLTYTLDGKPDPSVSTDPTRWQYTVDFDSRDSRWKIQNIESLADATFPC